jgi:outer membrane scaffolding protein for murein synthesis (MipA/OmpV family)
MTNARPPAFTVLAAFAVLLIGAGGSAARAEDAAALPAPTPFKYVLGGALSTHPAGVGGRKYETTPSLLWAVRWGRWRISAGGANALFGFGSEVTGSGASTDLVETKRWRVGVSLRLDSGRKSADADTTAGLPDIERTLRGRLFASYAVSRDWQLSGSLSQDLLGRQGGLLVGLDLGWRLRQTATTEWTAGAGIGAADGQHMRSYFGVTPAAALSSGLREFAPSAGLRDVHAGVGFTHELSRRWVTFGSAGVSRLLGPAARSPLTQAPTGGQFGLGLAYRN